MSEAITLKIVNSGEYDGTSVIDRQKSDLGELGSYTATVNEGGVIGSNILGLMTPNSTKLISIAGEVNGFSGARVTVTRPDSPQNPREEITLLSRFQRVVLAGGEVLRIFWDGPRQTKVVHLLIQDLAERECTPVMRVEHRPKGVNTRFHIVFNGGGVTHGPNNFGIEWTWNNALQMFLATFPAPAAGHLGLKDLTFDQDVAGRGVYVWTKFGGTPISEVGTLHWFTNEHLVVDGGLVPDGWSKPIWISGNDKLIFRAPPPAVGANVTVDLEVSPLRTRIITGAYK